MLYYFAPMEGLTDRIYRRLHHQYFGGVDRYYMPFLSPSMHRCLTPKERRELPHAQEDGLTAIPQILTKSPEDFLWAAQQCADLGYDLVNLNLGCPSGTVVAKKKGAGMLADLTELARFLDIVCARTPIPLSVKTRLGLSSPEEFPAILNLLRAYPLSEIILHPRVRQAFYSGNVDRDAFRYLVENRFCPICYNGNLCSLGDIAALAQEYPQVEAVMLGRGLIADPGMLCPDGTDRGTLEIFLDSLLDAYTQAFGSARNAMFRMKENWHYLLCRFSGSEKLGKQLRKTTDVAQYRAISREIFATLPMVSPFTPTW